jgi:hypothetical protein
MDEECNEEIKREKRLSEAQVEIEVKISDCKFDSISMFYEKAVTRDL